MAAAESYCIVSYLYRDASNYKWHSSFVVKGSISLEQLQPFMMDGEYFVPQSIGIPSLTPELRTEDDHDLHEITDIAPCESRPFALTARELIRRMRTSGTSIPIRMPP